MRIQGRQNGTFVGPGMVESGAARWSKWFRTSASSSMRVVSHPEAEGELAAAALWYEARQPGLGEDFLDPFQHTLRRIVAEPERWRNIRGEHRKLNFHRFPYAIV